MASLVVDRFGNLKCSSGAVNWIVILSEKALVKTAKEMELAGEACKSDHDAPGKDTTSLRKWSGHARVMPATL